MLVALLVVLVLLVIYGGVLYNGLITLRRQTQTAFGQVDIQLRRRYDVLPRVVEIVEGDLKNERETMEKLLQARNQALNARTVVGRASAETQVGRALGAILALADAHADLRSDEDLLAVREDLRNIQNKVAFARQYYNDIAAAYNLRLDTFPSSLIASLGKFTPIETFEIEDATQREPIKARF